MDLYLDSLQDVSFSFRMNSVLFTPDNGCLQSDMTEGNDTHTIVTTCIHRNITHTETYTTDLTVACKLIHTMGILYIIGIHNESAECGC